MLDLGKGVWMKLVLVPAGRFNMGSRKAELDREPDEGPIRPVTITHAFYMGAHEVTQEQYEAIIGANPSKAGGSRRPVEGIWFADAAEFCRRLSARTGLTVRLPTEAEWEYACRAGTNTRFSFGDEYQDLPSYGNCCDRANTGTAPWRDPTLDDRFDGTAPVGSFRPNAWGLYDMHGNVFEWCADWYKDSYAGAAAVDPRCTTVGAYHVLRGGSWMSPPWQCRSAYRHRFTGDGRYNHLIGFRVLVEDR